MRIRKLRALVALAGIIVSEAQAQGKGGDALARESGVKPRVVTALASAQAHRVKPSKTRKVLRALQLPSETWRGVKSLLRDVYDEDRVRSSPRQLPRRAKNHQQFRQVGQ